jgi:TolB protein
VRKVTRRLALLAAIAAVTTSTSLAQPPGGGDEDLPAVQLSGAGVEMLKLALPKADGDSGEVTATMSKDMDITGLFQLLDPASFPAQLQSEGLGFSSALWSQVGAQAVIKMKVSGGALEGRVYITARGDGVVFTKSYRAADIRDAVHAFANDVVKSFTGQPGVFGSRIALAMTGHGPHEIAVVDMDGGRT